MILNIFFTIKAFEIQKTNALDCFVGVDGIYLLRTCGAGSNYCKVIIIDDF